MSDFWLGFTLAMCIATPVGFILAAILHAGAEADRKEFTDRYEKDTRS